MLGVRVDCAEIMMYKIRLYSVRGVTVTCQEGAESVVYENRWIVKRLCWEYDRQCLLTLTDSWEYGR